MDSYQASDQQLLASIGKQLLRRRLNLNWSQSTLAERAGTSRNSIQALETGRGARLQTFIQVLRALDSLELLASLIQTEPLLSPLQLASMQGKPRQRASAQKKDDGS